MSLTLIYPDDATREACAALVSVVRDAGGRAVFVGGCVRDALLGLPLKDMDVEVYGLAPDRLKALLAKRFRISLVGQAFGVIKLCGLPVDVSLPRRESKHGLGHKGFFVTADPGMPFAEAAARRDFTVNAMGYDPAAEELLDAYGGQADLARRVLRHTSEKFAEDPLRVLRGMQFVARFDLEPAAETVALCRGLGMEGLPPERLFDEWRKLLVQGQRPGKGLAFLRAADWVRFFPELDALIGCAQEPAWHPEGDVWNHTLACLDAFAAEHTGDPWEDLVVGLAVLCHDFGKPLTTEAKDGRIRSYEHDAAGEAPTRAFLARLTAHKDLVDQVVPLVVHHMRVNELYRAQAGPGAIRRLADKVGRIDRLVRVDRADRRGRPPRVVTDFPAADWLEEQARALHVERSRPEPLVLGRHLIALGLTPGPHFGPLLAACYEAQLDGVFATVEDGVAHARMLIAQE